MKAIVWADSIPFWVCAGDPKTLIWARLFTATIPNDVPLDDKATSTSPIVFRPSFPEAFC